MDVLRDRCVIVTGASRGIGTAIARHLAREGMRLALVARSADALTALARELSHSAQPALAIAADLSHTSALDGVVERVLREFGRVDVLVNNAGIDGYRSYASESDAQTREMIELNLLVPMLLTRKVLPGMLAQGSGHIVNIGSLAGKTGTPFCVSYATSKAGLIAFTHSLRAELSGSGVSASVVTPGFISDDGMFAQRQRSSGVEVSRLLGTSRSEHVARAVVRALREDSVELLVNPGPIRAMQALNALAPHVFSWMQKRIGVNAMLRRLAGSEVSVEHPGPERTL
jgi:short-subunit dehydrogenase